MIVYQVPTGVEPGRAGWRPTLSLPEGGKFALDRMLFELWQAADGQSLAAIEARFPERPAGETRAALACLVKAGLLARRDVPSPTPLEYPPVRGKLVSAVVVSTNEGRWLEGCFASLLAQTYQPLELILVDNASQDGSGTLVSQKFPGVRVLRLENGPPVGFPVQFRIMGENLEQLRAIAGQVAEIMRSDPNLQNIHLDWNEKVKSVRVAIDQDRARLLGVSSQDVALTLQAWLKGAAITQFREGDQLIDVVWRGSNANRDSLDGLPELDIATASGGHVPLAQVARLEPVLEEGIIWRRDRLPTITVRADLAGKTTGPAVSARVNPRLDPIRAQLPPGFRIEMGGTVEESAKGEKSIQAVMPLMVVGVITLLMIQLQSMRRTIMVLLTAPLGLIGVTLSLLIFQVPFGFVAQLGVIALMGMILRNSVILVDQIDQDEKAGKSTWEAIVGSTVRRFRPIVLTAAAAVLAMIPLTRQIFWGPMAVAIMGGLVVATALTCLFLPALYAAWYRVKEE